MIVIIAQDMNRHLCLQTSQFSLERARDEGVEFDSGSGILRSALVRAELGCGLGPTAILLQTRNNLEKYVMDLAQAT